MPSGRQVGKTNLYLLARDYDRETFAPFGTTSSKDCAACRRGHALAKAMGALTTAIVWLIGAFHRGVFLRGSVRRGVA